VSTSTNCASGMPLRVEHDLAVAYIEHAASVFNIRRSTHEATATAIRHELSREFARDGIVYLDRMDATSREYYDRLGDAACFIDAATREASREIAKIRM